MNGAGRRVNGFIEGLADVAAALGPLLAPLPSVYIAWLHMTQIMLWDPWMAGVIGAGVEMLGFATVETGVRFWRRNKEKDDAQEPLALVVGVGVFYLVVITLSNVIIAPEAGAVKVYKGLLSLLPVVGAVTVAVRSQSTRMEREARATRDDAARQRRETNAIKRQYEHERKLAEIELRKAELVAQKTAETDGKDAAIFGEWRTWHDVPAEWKRKLAGKSTKEIQRLTGKPERTSYNWSVYAKRDYLVVSENGSGRR
ncbi:MAG: hypothetical protein HN413_08135 [Chloroflexi bacterium]|jgi:hypothetical protein|nr:hypothetical protein [Chloroflexota bacterium]